jgi:hypothetical protein
LNNNIEKYDTYLNKNIFLEMNEHPEKADAYKNSNETKVVEIDSTIQGITLQI